MLVRTDLLLLVLREAYKLVKSSNGTVGFGYLMRSCGRQEEVKPAPQLSQQVSFGFWPELRAQPMMEIRCGVQEISDMLYRNLCLF